MTEPMYSDLEAKSYLERDSLDTLQLNAFIKKHELASFPLTLERYGYEELLAIADKINNIAEQWPSCAIALCMHYNVLIAINKMPIFATAQGVLDAVRNNEALIASAFSELVPGRGIFSPTLEFFRRDSSTIVLNGSKKPCTLASLADFMVASCRESDTERLRLALIPRHKDLQVDASAYKFSMLGASDTSGIKFNNLNFPSNVLDQTKGDVDAMVLLNYGMSIFNMLISAAYSGIVTALFKKMLPVLNDNSEVIVEYLRLSAWSQVVIKNIVRTTVEGFEDQQVNEVLLLRYQLERTILEFVEIVWKCSTARSIMVDPDILHLLNTCRLIKYHPLTEKRFLDELSKEI